MPTRPKAHQQRSEQTLRRLEKAAIRLLESRTWAELKLTELVSEARSSIGSFYNLFGDKDGLLDHLDERYAREMIDHIKDFLGHRHVDLEEAARDLFSGLVAFHRRRRGLIRALVLRARTLREPAYDERTRRMNAMGAALCDHLHRHRPEIPPERVLLGFSFGFSALRDRVLFPESVELESQLDDRVLAEALAEQFIRFVSP